MKYTLVFLFDKNCENVLLCRKDTVFQSGEWGGILGKLTPHLFGAKEACRSVFERTSLDPHVSDMNWIVDMDLTDKSRSYSLSVYASIGNLDQVQRHDDYEMKLFKVKDIVMMGPNDNTLKGDGLTQYLVNISWMGLKYDKR